MSSFSKSFLSNILSLEQEKQFSFESCIKITWVYSHEVLISCDSLAEWRKTSLLSSPPAAWLLLPVARRPAALLQGAAYFSRGSLVLWLIQQGGACALCACDPWGRGWGMVLHHTQGSGSACALRASDASGRSRAKAKAVLSVIFYKGPVTQGSKFFDFCFFLPVIAFFNV